MFWVSEKRHERTVDHLNGRIQYLKDELADADELADSLNKQVDDLKTSRETALEDLERVSMDLKKYKFNEEEIAKFLRDDPARLDFTRENTHMEAVPIFLDYAVNLEDQLKTVTATLIKTQDVLKRCEMMNKNG